MLGESRRTYLTRVDELLDGYIACFTACPEKDTGDFSQLVKTDDFLQMRQKLRAFCTQEVILHKWAPLNWVFVRRSIERALELDEGLVRPLLAELFDEVTKSSCGFAAMDFGYAFDSLIWVSILFYGLLSDLDLSSIFDREIRYLKSIFLRSLLFAVYIKL